MANNTNINIKKLLSVFPFWDQPIPDSNDPDEMDEYVSSLLVEIERRKGKEAERILKIKEQSEKLEVESLDLILSSIDKYFKDAGTETLEAIRKEFEVWTTPQDQWKSLTHSIYTQSQDLIRKLRLYLEQNKQRPRDLWKVGQDAALSGGIAMLEGVSKVTASNDYSEDKEPLPFLQRILERKFSQDAIKKLIQDSATKSQEKIQNEWEEWRRKNIDENEGFYTDIDKQNKETKWDDKSWQAAKIAAVATVAAVLVVAFEAYSAMWALTTIFPEILLIVAPLVVVYAFAKKDENKKKLEEAAKTGISRMKNNLEMFAKSEMRSKLGDSLKTYENVLVLDTRLNLWGDKNGFNEKAEDAEKKFRLFFKDLRRTEAESLFMAEEGCKKGKEYLEKSQVEGAIFCCGQAFDGLLQWSSKKTGVPLIREENYQQKYILRFREKNYPEEFVLFFDNLRWRRNKMVHEYRQFNRDNPGRIQIELDQFFKDVEKIMGEIRKKI